MRGRVGVIGVAVAGVAVAGASQVRCKRSVAYTNRSLKLSQAGGQLSQRSFLFGLSLPTDCVVAYCSRGRTTSVCRSSPGWNRLNLLPLLPGVTLTLDTRKATVACIFSAFCVWAGFTMWSWLWCRGAFAWGVNPHLGMLQWPPTGSFTPRNENVSYPVSCSLSDPLLPQLHTPPLKWAVLLFVWCQDVDLLSKKQRSKEVVLS